MLQGVHHIGNEALGMQVDHLGRGRAARDGVADGVHQVRLAETHAAVDEQRVVRAARILRDLHGSGARQLIGLALDEGLEGKGGAQPGALAFTSPRAAGTAFGRRFDQRRAFLAGLQGFRLATKLPAADLYDDAGRVTVLQACQHLGQAVEQVLVDPVAHEVIGRKQSQRIAIFDGVQWPNPGVELLR